MVAEVLQSCGCYMGKNLNFAIDNMDSAFCFSGRISWIGKNFPFLNGMGEVDRYLNLFVKLNFGEKLSWEERRLAARISIEYLGSRNLSLVRNRPFADRVKNGLALFWDRWASSSVQPTASQWGFKETAALYFLHPLIDYFPGIKLVHLVRDGRDMALGSNQQDLLYHGALFDLEESYTPANAFAFWSASNRWALDVCRERLRPEQYLLVRYEDICSEPHREVDRILSFAGLPNPRPEEVYGIPVRSPRSGEWRERSDLFEGLDLTVLDTLHYL